MTNIKHKIEHQAYAYIDIYKDPFVALVATIIWIDDKYRFRYINDILSPENAFLFLDASFDIDQNRISELSELDEFKRLTAHKDIFIDMLFRSNRDELLANKICLAYDELTNKNGSAYKALLSSQDDETYFNYQSTLKRKRGNK